jgi:Excalibur calcium-binding domain/PASTA domain
MRTWTAGVIASTLLGRLHHQRRNQFQRWAVGWGAVIAILVALSVPDSALADSATITATDAGTGLITASIHVDSNTCSSSGYCGWFAFMAERHSSLGCQYDGVLPRWVGPSHDAAGSQDGTVTFRPFFPRYTKLCVFVTNANGNEQPVGETVVTLPAGYGVQRSSGYNCADFASQSAAQYYLELYLGDPSGLDGDNDGVACEDNPSPRGAEAIPAEPSPQPVVPPTPPPPPSCTVPLVIGISLAQATPSLAAAHCSLGAVSHEYSARVKRGLVISQSERQGSVLSNGSFVDLVLSRGRRPLTLSRAAAVHYMKAAVKQRFSPHPQQFMLTNCKRVSATSWRCTAAWRGRTFRYRGKVRIWIDQNHWYYSFDVRRTKLRCSRGCTRHIAIS